MTRERRERVAAMLLVGAVVLWLHQWVPALFMAAVVLWVVFHERLEGDRGQGLLRRWRRVWPPRTLVLVPLLLVGALAFWMAAASVTTMVLPVALNLLALSILSFGDWWRIFPRQEPSRSATSELPGPLRAG